MSREFAAGDLVDVFIGGARFVEHLYDLGLAVRVGHGCLWLDPDAPGVTIAAHSPAAAAIVAAMTPRGRPCPHGRYSPDGDCFADCTAVAAVIARDADGYHGGDCDHIARQATADVATLLADRGALVAANAELEKELAAALCHAQNLQARLDEGPACAERPL